MNTLMSDKWHRLCDDDADTLSCFSVSTTLPVTLAQLLPFFYRLPVGMSSMSRCQRDVKSKN